MRFIFPIFSIGLLSIFSLTATPQKTSASHKGYESSIAKNFIIPTIKPLNIQTPKINVPKIIISPKPTIAPTKIQPTNTPTPTPTTQQTIPTPTITQTPTIPPTETPTPTLVPTTAPPVVTGDITNFIMTQINNYRHSQGLSDVHTDSYTCSFAATRAQEITGGFNHDGFNNRVNSKTLPYPSYSLVTENIATTPNYQEVVNLWINSAPHAENMRADTPYVCVQNSGNYYAYEGWKP